jgi:hypothetical protein
MEANMVLKGILLGLLFFATFLVLAVPRVLHQINPSGGQFEVSGAVITWRTIYNPIFWLSLFVALAVGMGIVALWQQRAAH